MTKKEHTFKRAFSNRSSSSLNSAAVAGGGVLFCNHQLHLVHHARLLYVGYGCYDFVEWRAVLGELGPAAADQLPKLLRVVGARG